MLSNIDIYIPGYTGSKGEHLMVFFLHVFPSFPFRSSSEKPGLFFWKTITSPHLLWLALALIECNISHLRRANSIA